MVKHYNGLKKVSFIAPNSKIHPLSLNFISSKVKSISKYMLINQNSNKSKNVFSFLNLFYKMLLKINKLVIIL